MCVGFRVFLLLGDGDRANLLLSNNQYHLWLLRAAKWQAKTKYSGLDFPRFPYNPLRPQTTIAIDQVNTTSSDTQPNVKIAIVLLLKLFTKCL